MDRYSLWSLNVTTPRDIMLHGIWIKSIAITGIITRLLIIIRSFQLSCHALRPHHLHLLFKPHYWHPFLSGWYVELPYFSVGRVSTHDTLSYRVVILFPTLFKEASYDGLWISFALDTIQFQLNISNIEHKNSLVFNIISFSQIPVCMSTAGPNKFLKP